MRIVCAPAMEELILVNKRKGLLANCAEYTTDIPLSMLIMNEHNVKRHQSLNTTLPHSDTRYPNVELFVVDEDNSLKLEIGTQTMNLLITSSIRIDRNRTPAIGLSSTSGFNVSKDTLIFIRRSFIEGMAIYNNKAPSFAE